MIDIPNYKLVIVAAAGELKAVWTPFEPAYLLLMTFKATDQAVLHPNVVMKYHRIKRATAEHVWAVPCERADPTEVLALECSYALRCLHIPQLDLLTRSADSELVIAWLFLLLELTDRAGSPSHRGNDHIIILCVEEKTSIACMPVPQINRLGQTHRQLI